VIVLSTGNKPPHPRNDTRDQTYPHTHVVRCNPNITYSQNLRRVCSELDPAEIVVSLDADDWLAHPLALERVAEAHGAGAWVTYGSYRFADGRPAPWQRAYGPDEDVRRAPWCASHLKSYRAGLVHRLQPQELILEHGRDQALMFACLEMAGHDRAAFLAEVLYVYNWAESFEFSASPTELAREAKQVAAIRARVPYARVGAL
jgi:hypothetical protein